MHPDVSSKVRFFEEPFWTKMTTMFPDFFCKKINEKTFRGAWNYLIPYPFDARFDAS